MFGWFKKEKSVEKSPTHKVILHGHDLSKWHYLGYTQCSYVNEAGEATSKYPIFLFVSKDNDKIRSYSIPNDRAGWVEKNHAYVTKNIMPWKAGEGNIYQFIQGKENYPSDYLKEYMLEKFNAVWSTETNWWDTTDKVKYEQAKRTQRKKKTESTTVKTEDDKVIEVDFGKK